MVNVDFLIGRTGHRQLTMKLRENEVKVWVLMQLLSEHDKAENPTLPDTERVDDYDILVVDGERQHYLNTVDLAKAKDVLIVQGEGCTDPLNCLGPVGSL